MVWRWSVPGSGRDARWGHCRFEPAAGTCTSRNQGLRREARNRSQRWTIDRTTSSGFGAFPRRADDPRPSHPTAPARIPNAARCSQGTTRQISAICTSSRGTRVFAVAARFLPREPPPPRPSHARPHKFRFTFRSATSGVRSVGARAVRRTARATVPVYTPRRHFRPSDSAHQPGTVSWRMRLRLCWSSGLPGTPAAR